EIDAAAAPVAAALAGAGGGGGAGGAGGVGGVGGVGYGGDGGQPPDRSELAGLQPVPSIDGPTATIALEPPPTEATPVPFYVSLALTVCVVFTIFAGVSSPMIDFARHATTLF
ncbi:MAG TPA: hypothetical protein VMO88_08905, partial [Acidimicrobiales bacterium]|nr:hypothetical protein [Acidimicrobiales bacterium]